MDRTMTSGLWGPLERTKEATGPERKPRRSSVFIHDAVTPVGDTTLLLALWQHQQAKEDDQ
ncbi:hypothetical protein J7426_16390 [Tropicibacter sp. R16_0]|uniref:hypothetical protein n=1 Tax=Tropicibacter sp. R16_0 TaxID=2821102 RepID=UPI001ADCAC97|nr:hypothetical protein [Tropicibacter sp. R16_0]MBO9451855.1 hypothetical protein [Tropicibacter sp. R16_0]